MIRFALGALTGTLIGIAGVLSYVVVLTLLDPDGER